MNNLKKVAMASLVGAALFTGTSFAATPAMDSAAYGAAKTVASKVNGGAAVSCNSAAHIIAKAAQAQKGKLTGAALRSAVSDSISKAATKTGLAGNCITQVVASNAASTATGFSTAAAKPTLGLGKAGGSLAGGVGVGTAAAVVAGLVVAAVIINNNDDDDNSVSAKP